MELPGFFQEEFPDIEKGRFVIYIHYRDHREISSARDRRLYGKINIQLKLFFLNGSD
jgi:hypothetical protein